MSDIENDVVTSDEGNESTAQANDTVAEHGEADSGNIESEVTETESIVPDDVVANDVVPDNKELDENSDDFALVGQDVDAEGEAKSGAEDGAELKSAESSEAADASNNTEHNPEQAEMPFAIVQGKAITELPKDLYIPPDALEVILEAFEGPLDLLLYLIRRQNIDILEIDVSEITRQYVGYVEIMKAVHFELAAEYLVMAAMLAEIKSRMLLPRSEEVDEEEEDPRALLIRRLQEYERFKQAAEDIDELPRQHRDTHTAKAEGPDRNLTRPDPDVDMKELLVALSEVLRRSNMFESHHVEKEKLSTRERMTQVLDQLKDKQFVPFVSLFKVTEGRLGVVVTFLAVMELIKESLVEIVQTEIFGPIHVKACSQ